MPRRQNKRRRGRRRDDYTPSEIKNLSQADDGNYVLPGTCPRTYEQLCDILPEKVEAYRPRNPKFDRNWRLRKHDGSRRLLLADIEFLTRAVADIQGASGLPLQVVYCGASRCLHVKLLAWLFPTIHRWHLVDFVEEGHAFRHVKVGAGGGEIHYVKGETCTQGDYLLKLLRWHHGDDLLAAVKAHNHVVQRFNLLKPMANEQELKKFRDRIAPNGAVLLISAICSPYFKDTPDKKVEELRWRDMKLQHWLHDGLNTAATMLSVRFPYVWGSGVLVQGGQTINGVPVPVGAPVRENVYFPFLELENYLPIWGRGATTTLDGVKMDSNLEEGVPDKIILYDVTAIQDFMHFFNKQVREPTRYEGLCELYVLQNYMNSLHHRGRTFLENNVREILRDMNLDTPGGLSQLITWVLRDGARRGDQLQPDSEARVPNPRRRISIPEFPPAPPHYSTAQAPATSGERTRKRGPDTGRDLLNKYSYGRDVAQPQPPRAARLCNIFHENFVYDPACPDSVLKEGLKLLLHEGHLKFSPGDTPWNYPRHCPTAVILAEYGRMDLLSHMLEAYPTNILQVTGTVDTLLSAAVFFGQVHVVQWILRALSTLDRAEVREYLLQSRRPRGKHREYLVSGSRKGQVRPGTTELGLAYFERQQTAATTRGQHLHYQWREHVHPYPAIIHMRSAEQMPPRWAEIGDALRNAMWNAGIPLTALGHLDLDELAAAAKPKK